MTQRITQPLALSIAAILPACSAGATGGPVINSVNPSSPSYSSLQFAVGTANIFGSLGLNVVSTFRQNNGTSGTGVNTPTITGPFTIPSSPSPGGGSDPYSTVLNGGPSLTETSSSVGITGTPQTVAPGTPECDGTGSVAAGLTACQGGIPPNTTTFGQSGGVFAMGLGPYNAQAETGMSWSYQPYPQPFYDTTGNAAYIPWGGPPAFDPDGTKLGERDGVGAITPGVDGFGDPFFLGVGEGVTAFENVTPSTGTYTLNVAIATIGNGGSVSTSNVTKAAKLSSLTMLPAISAPVVTPDSNGDGGANFTTSLPAGVTEAYVQIVDYGPGGGPAQASPASSPSNCQGARGTRFAPVYYTFHVTNPVSASYTLPATIGPNLANSGGVSNIQPSPSLCTAAQNTAANNGTPTPADDLVVQMIGFDYPVYQAALGLTQTTTPQNPSITGPSGQSDITISVPEEQDNGGTAQHPASVHHRPEMRLRKVR